MLMPARRQQPRTDLTCIRFTLCILLFSHLQHFLQVVQIVIVRYNLHLVPWYALKACLVLLFVDLLNLDLGPTRNTTHRTMLSQMMFAHVGLRCAYIVTVTTCNAIMQCQSSKLWLSFLSLHGWQIFHRTQLHANTEQLGIVD